MDNLLAARIQNRMDQFSKGQKRIAAYIGEHYDKVAFMTASKLGTTVGVSESTVVRFATEIGYKGYPELQQAMQEMIRNKLTSVQRMEVTANRIGDSDVLDFVFSQDIDVIRRTMEETSHDSFYQAVDAIVASRKIYILAARSALALGTFLSYYFNLLFENVLLVQSTSEGEIFEQMIRINEAPAIEVHVVKSSEPPGGMGETGTSAVVPAIANAVFAATGKRLRKMPIDAGALKQV